MGEFGQKSWEETPPYFGYFRKIAESKFPSIDLTESCKAFERERRSLREYYAKILDSISKVPLVCCFVIWTKEIGCLRPEMLVAAQDLLENGFISDTDVDENLLTIAKVRGMDHHKKLDAIRCKHDWPIQRRENAVRTYIDFLFWLSRETNGYVERIEDLDWVRTQKRKLAFPLFIQFLEALPSEKSRLIAKMLYFGQKHSLDEILSLKIENIKFKNNIVIFPESQPESYPEHVFADIKAITEGRSDGLVFLGRQDAPLNDGTIFRHFNQAASRVGLGDSFGPKRLVENSDDSGV